MIELTESQQKALDNQAGGHLQMVDPRSKQVYSLVPVDVLEWLYSSVEGDELDKVDVGRLIAEAMREDDENDPLLESYQKYKDEP
jgi:hypothetical protein